MGLVATTTDPNGNIIGSGVISSEGTITYNIDEGMLPGGTVITTTVGPDSANHNLKASFYFAREGGDWYPYVFVQRDLNNGWIGQNSDDYLAPNISGEIIVEYDNEQYLVDLSDFAGEQQILLKKSGASAYPYAYDAKATNDLTKVKIRFRNVSSELFLQVGQADHFYKFFDDGIQQVGYQLAWRNAPTHSNIVIKEIPNYLPASVKNLNAMFWGDDQESYLFDSAITESKLSNWDFSNVTKMITTFAYSKFYDLPISNLTLTNLVYAIETFAVSNFNKAINWITPALESVCYMFGDNIDFNSNIDMTFDNVVDASSFLQGASSFNKPLEHLNTVNVENFAWFLSECAAFNQPMNLLNVASCKNFNFFFKGCTSYNQPMSDWNLASLVNTPESSGLYGFLMNALNYSQDLSMWCVTPHLTEPAGFNQNGIMTTEQKPVWGTCPVPIDTSWDVEYVLGGQTFRALTGDPIPFQYMNGSSATSLTINRTITNLSHQVCMNWPNATVLNLPDTLVYMGQYCFIDWIKLLEIVIPDSVVTIFGSAFQGARAATKVVFGSSLETVGAFSFTDLWNCKEVIFRSQTPPVFQGDALMGLPADVKYYIPAGTRAAYKSGFLQFIDDSKIFEVP